MDEVLNGNPIRSVNAFRMHSNMFLKLCGELESTYILKASDRMTVVEKLGIFIYTLALGVSNRDVSERFQRSGETISRAFHEVLEAITARSKGFHGLAREMIKPKYPTFQETPPQIMNDKRYMPYFKDCIDCIDGTHIGACIPEKEQVSYIGRKGVPTFNVMAMCDFDLCFTFIPVGWEGSAHDTSVFLSAINNPSMNFPKPPKGITGYGYCLLVVSNSRSSAVLGTIPSIPIGSSISPEGFLLLVLLLVVIIVMVVIVIVILIVVVDDVSLILKLSFTVISFLHRIMLYYLIH
ncbi:putative nuclease HARBI1 [Tanacetum coccineum]|uniref:Nuclease HARBI1 n=1 Tax=Tanacetum coccineum TaxID=301880 RepID=A0ABQ5GAR2_9ASTR